MRAVGAQVLLVVQTRDAGQRREAQQHLGQRVARQPEEAQEAPRHLVAVGVLLEPAEVHPRLEQVPAAHIGWPCR